jgi:hypothetical protein
MQTITLIDYARPLAERAKARKFCGPYQWSPTRPGKGRGFYSSTRDALTIDRAGSTFSLRLESANDHLRGTRLARTTGCYCDPHGDSDTLQPIIARLPHGRGFLAGWTMGAGMAGSVSGEIYGDETDAAYAAHALADYDATASREAQEIADYREARGAD